VNQKAITEVVFPVGVIPRLYEDLMHLELKLKESPELAE
jgi:hypothetical protein